MNREELIRELEGERFVSYSQEDGAVLHLKEIVDRVVAAFWNDFNAVTVVDYDDLNPNGEYVQFFMELRTLEKFERRWGVGEKEVGGE